MWPGRVSDKKGNETACGACAWTNQDLVCAEDAEKK
jgi:hypothetical protein